MSIKNMNEEDHGSDFNCCSPAMGQLGRRQFIQASGLTAALALANPSSVMAGPFQAGELVHLIPADKKLSKEWISSLYARGEALSASAGEFDYLGMPISGICTGQVYLSGDGRLWLWNLDASMGAQHNPKGLGYMQPPKSVSPYDIGFAIEAGGETRTLDAQGFRDVQFTNAYPMGRVAYSDESSPVSVDLEAWTPFIPLNRDDSSFPAVVMRYTVNNTSSKKQEVSIAGWNQNISSRKTLKEAKGKKVSVYHEFENLSAIECSAESANGNPMKAGVDTCTTAIGMLGEQRPDLVNLAKKQPGAQGVFESTSKPESGTTAKADFNQPGFTSVGRKLLLKPGESQTVSFVVSWSFPLVAYGVAFGAHGTKVGRNHYATQYPTAVQAAKQLAAREQELLLATQSWTETWYASTLPHWFLERTFVTLNCIQTQMGQRVFAKGSETDIYNFEEGVRCCPGNCTHVWHYAQGLSRIFPVIERENRDRIEYGVGFNDKDGSIGHRYQRGQFGDAIDGNCGTILRVLRESQMTTDYTFLKNIWERVELSMEHVIKKWDADEDGMLVGAQHNTLDEPWHGQVHWLTNLYHAALKASAMMARQMDKPGVAKRYDEIVEKGMPAMVKLLWNEEFGYFIHKPGDLETEKHGSTNGCHIDQVLGDSWLHHVGLDPILPADKIKKALQALWKFNFTPQVGEYRKVVTNGRWYAGAGDAGLVMCSFPNGKIEPKSGKKSYAGYLNECMTGFEWQVASHMIWHGMIEEGLAIGKAINDRYQPKVRNPYNEIECSDHYSRAMASYGAFTAMCGYQYDGPQGKLAFGPKMQQSDFRAAFTTAEGWGSFSQKVDAGNQSAMIELRYGQLVLQELTLDAVEGTTAAGVSVTLAGAKVQVDFEKSNGKCVLKFVEPTTVNAGDSLVVELM